MIDLSQYRPGIGLMLLNKQKQVFVGDRVDEVEASWQMPQGGIDAGETPQQALIREALEEIGCDKIQIIHESPQWLHYDLPQLDSYIDIWGGKYKGQRQKWFLCQFTGEDSEIDLNAHNSPEFISWKWVDKEELPNLIVGFKKQLYLDVLNTFSNYF